jgi:hypothetical protein
MENMSFGRFIAGPHHQDHPSALGGILDSSRLAAIFAGLEFAGLLCLQRFADDSPGNASYQSSRPMPVHRHKMRTDRGKIHPHNCQSFRDLEAVMVKKMAPLTLICLGLVPTGLFSYESILL